MNKRVIAAVLGAAALAVPAAAGAHSEHERPGKEMEKGKGKHKRAKKVTFVFKGEFIEPGFVEVRWGNSHVRRGGFLGETVEFDLEHAKVVVADTNGDGRRDVADVADGDRVLVVARLHKRTKYVPPAEEHEAPEAAAARDYPPAGEKPEGEGPKRDRPKHEEPKGERSEHESLEPIVARKLIDRTHPPVDDEDEPAHDE